MLVNVCVGGGGGGEGLDSVLGENVCFIASAYCPIGVPLYANVKHPPHGFPCLLDSLPPEIDQ